MRHRPSGVPAFACIPTERASSPLHGGIGFSCETAEDKKNRRTAGKKLGG